MCTDVVVPENAELNYLGNDWTCRRGFRRVGSRCQEIQIPENAELNYLGNDWACRRGFRRVGNGCQQIQVPENAELNYLGNDWACKRGFRRDGRACVAVQVPANAELDYLGNGWRCQRGYARNGSSCVAIKLPENAELDMTGNNWMCSLGFKKAGTKCAAMSERERQAQEVAIQHATTRARRVTSSSCKIDGKPAKGDKAEVTIKRSGCRSYFVADGPNGDYLLEWYGGHDPSEGDVIIGPINSYGFVDVCYPGYGEGRVYVDDYMLSSSRAIEKLAEKCN